MKKISRILPALAAAALLCASCTREPLHEEGSSYRVKFNIDYSMIYGTPVEPKLMTVLIYDPATGQKVGQEFISPTGGFINSVLPGNTYDFIVYNYDTETTGVSGTDFHNTVKAFTSSTHSGSSLIIAEPDHLYVDVLNNIYIPHIPADDLSVFTIETHPKTILDTYKLVVEGIKGLKNAQAIAVYIGGQASGRMLGTGNLISESCYVSFKGLPNYATDEIVNVFNTFGKLPDVPSDIILNIMISGADGATYVLRKDVTSQFLAGNNPEHIIRAEFDATINPRKEGGIEPSVDPWDTEHEQWNIE